MTVTRNVILLVLSIVAFLLAAILAAQWFGTHPKAGDVEAIGFVGLALFAGAHLP